MDKILIVDDDPTFLKELRVSLQKYESQFELLTTDNVNDAVQLLQDHIISVVVTDLIMPQLSGLDLLSVVQENYPNLPCLLLTEGEPAKPAVDCYPHDSFPLLQKPINEHTLAGTIIDAMDRRDEGRVPKKTPIHILLQLIEMEERSCVVEVQGRAGRRGTFVFREGELQDAQNRKLTGEAAALEMLQWGEVAFRLQPLNHANADRKSIDIHLHKLLQTPAAAAAPTPAQDGGNGSNRSEIVCPGTQEEIDVEGRPITVLVVDDSKMMRKAVTRSIEPVKELRIVGEAGNGEEALMQIARLRPDVVTLDVEMPLMDGITTLKHMMIQTPTPTVMLSSLTREGSRVTFDALRFGAVDFLTKPSNLSPDGVARQSEELVRRVKMAAEVELDSVQYIHAPCRMQSNRTPAGNEIRNVVGIGAAEGGPGSLLKLIPGLTPDRPAAYLSMVYMAPEYVGAFAEYLDQHSCIPIHRATDGQRVQTGHVYLASGEEYMTCEKAGTDLLLRVHPAPFAKRRGSINMMLFAIADAVGSGAAGLLLSGAGRDGSEGLEEIMHVGGAGMVLSPGRCMYKEMVTHAIEKFGPGILIAEKGTADEIEPLLS